jgi:putative cell wall-binding protein
MNPGPPGTYHDSNFIPQVHPTTVYRIAGSDRIATAIKAAQTKLAWGQGVANRFGIPGFVNGCNVILARDDDFADALVSGPLADVRNAPILVNPTGSLDARVAAEIGILAGQCHAGPGIGNGPGAQFKVTIVGGISAISDGIMGALGGQYKVERLSGPDRYATSLTVAHETVAMLQNHGIRYMNVILATGTNWPDALAAGPAATSHKGIVLLTNGTVMDPDTKAYLKHMATETYWGHTPTVFAAGGPAAAAAPDAIPFVGRDRYQTASMLADYFFKFLPSGNRIHNVGVASGENYADAVIAGGFMANSDGPLLLTHKTYLVDVTAAYLSSQRDWVNNAFVFGGEGVIDPVVATEVSAALFN